MLNRDLHCFNDIYIQSTNRNLLIDFKDLLEGFLNLKRKETFRKDYSDLECIIKNSGMNRFYNYQYNSNHRRYIGNIEYINLYNYIHIRVLTENDSCHKLFINIIEKYFESQAKNGDFYYDVDIYNYVDCYSITTISGDEGKFDLYISAKSIYNPKCNLIGLLKNLSANEVMYILSEYFNLPLFDKNKNYTPLDIDDVIIHNDLISREVLGGGIYISKPKSRLPLDAL